MLKQPMAIADHHSSLHHWSNELINSAWSPPLMDCYDHQWIKWLHKPNHDENQLVGNGSARFIEASTKIQSHFNHEVLQLDDEAVTQL